MEECGNQERHQQEAGEGLKESLEREVAHFRLVSRSWNPGWPAGWKVERA